MKRRLLLTSATSGLVGLLAGCTQGGIFAGSGGSPHAEQAPLPDLSAPNVSPDDAKTTLRVEWRAIGATRFDVDPNDGIETVAPEESKYVVLGHSTSNEGETAIQFDPAKFTLESRDAEYTPEALTHLTPFYDRPLRPGNIRGGWVAFLIPSDIPAATLTVSQWASQEPFAVEFEHDPSVHLPF